MHLKSTSVVVHGATQLGNDLIRKQNNFEKKDLEGSHFLPTFGLDAFTIVSRIKGIPFKVISHNSDENIGSFAVGKDLYVANFIWPDKTNIHEKIAWYEGSGSTDFVLCFGDSNRQKSQLSHLGKMICLYNVPKLIQVINNRKPSLIANNFQCDKSTKLDPNWSTKKKGTTPASKPAPCDAVMITIQKDRADWHLNLNNQRGFHFLTTDGNPIDPDPSPKTASSSSAKKTMLMQTSSNVKYWQPPAQRPEPSEDKEDVDQLSTISHDTRINIAKREFMAIYLNKKVKNLPYSYLSLANFYCPQSPQCTQTLRTPYD
ncbi:hypothetical protein SAMD00019534_014810 [Acytostelium subglobosum LB1]|uniref:hypothetical protein n=1 Tax=Acytostelium subglobosum LB1 TaxID=1410327 RepID=UPI00064487D0|nr:hypothetical protein SAMD00019534_014810 [Acytostelium subglobosum LB1]GAM18306.1 hypothetical protein SAMD00019534_014810 [Acytostelium subglobosum LB1]|eukprot:XP_012757526.1 hypothetical protein SAMD00019534_014810 [Acytostelium subglobosum LB1]